MAAVVVVLLAASVGTWWAKRTPDPRRLGVRGSVTAQVSDPCDAIDIDGLDGLTLHGDFEATGTGTTMPDTWEHGDHIEGTIRLDRKTGEHGVRGTFTAADGTVVPVVGGIEGKVFFTATCVIGG